MNDMSTATISVMDLIEDNCAALRKWRGPIEAALSHAKEPFSFDDVVMMVMRQQLTLYVFDDAIILMELSTYPKWKAFHCFIAAGNMQTIKAAEPMLNTVASALGCKYLSISGRVGWARELKPNGWEHVFSVMYKKVAH